jgi:hypothetical protein
MSSDMHLLLEALLHRTGFVLDTGGGQDTLQQRILEHPDEGCDDPTLHT